MPILSNSSFINWTNQELLLELQKRIQAGTIALQVNNQVQADPLTSKLFNIQVSKAEKEAETNSSPPRLLDNNTLLWLGLGVIVVLLIWKKSFTLKTKVDLVDKS